jgi:hypothetical protein
MDRKPPRDVKKFEGTGAFLAIIGLISLLAGFVIEFEWTSAAMKIGGIAGIVVGLSLVAVGNLIRDWD